MYAIVKTGAKQYKVAAGDVIRVESLQAEVGKSIELEQVLLTYDKENVTVGSPFINGTKILAKVLSIGREKKITVIKFRRRKDSRLKQGHRQYYTELQIEKISVSGDSVKKTTEKPAKKIEKTKAVPTDAQSTEAKTKSKKAPNQETASKTEAKKSTEK